MNAIPIVIALGLILLGAVLMSGVLPLSAIGQATIRVQTNDISGNPVQGVDVTIWATHGTTEVKVYVGEPGANGLAEAQIFMGDPGDPIPIATIGEPLPYRIELWHSERGYHDTAGPFYINPGETKTHVFSDLPTQEGDEDEIPGDEEEEMIIDGPPSLEELVKSLDKNKTKLIGLGASLIGVVWLVGIWRTSQIKKTYQGS